MGDSGEWTVHSGESAVHSQGSTIHSGESAIHSEEWMTDSRTVSRKTPVSGGLGGPAVTQANQCV